MGFNLKANDATSLLNTLPLFPCHLTVQFEHLGLLFVGACCLLSLACVVEACPRHSLGACAESLPGEPRQGPELLHAPGVLGTPLWVPPVLCQHSLSPCALLLTGSY